VSRDPHVLFASAILRDGQTFDPILAQIQGELDELGRGEVDPDRLAAVKSHVRYATLTDQQTPADVADLVARFVGVGGSLDMIDLYLEELAAVTAQDVARVAHDFLNTNRRFVVTLSHGPAPGGEAAPPTEVGTEAAQ
jgi:predicted Zn-dependent peptidase